MPSNLNSVAGGTASITVAEQVLAVLGPVTLNLPAGAQEQGYQLEATVVGVGTASTTGIILRIRAGSGTGGAALVTSPTLPVAGAVGFSESLNWLDATMLGLGVIAETYTLTAAMVGAASGAWTATFDGQAATAAS
jgi:hypothetical protein